MKADTIYPFDHEKGSFYKDWKSADKLKYCRFLKVELDRNMEKMKKQHDEISQELQEKLDHLVLELEGFK